MPDPTVRIVPAARLRLVGALIAGGLLLALGVAGSATPDTAPRFEPTSESLRQYRCPDWFRDAKLGIYAHWGPSAVPPYPGNTDWYSHWMYVEGHPVNLFHVETYGPVDRFGYKDLVPMFTAEAFDAEAWAELCQKAGARFAGPVAEHADGFAMWDSALTEWDAKERGPRRDVVAEWERAVRRPPRCWISSAAGWPGSIPSRGSPTPRSPATPGATPRRWSTTPPTGSSTTSSTS